MGPKPGSLPGGCGLGSVFPTYARRVAPQPLEVVVRAFLGTENMNDVDIVEEPPPRAGFAFPSDRAHSQPFSDPILDALDHRLDLPLGARGADHEEVGDHDELVDVQDDDGVR